MGKNKITKRVTIQRQFVTSYILVLILSLIATFIATVSFYSVYHHLSGYDNVKISNGSVRGIIEYAQKYGNTISEGTRKDELDKLVRKNNMEYYIKDMNNKILFTSIKEHSEKYHKSLVWDLWIDILNNSLGTSNVSIPLSNTETGKVERVFILMQYDRLWFVLLIFVDIGIPFTCFVIFTLMFARRISRRIRTPLNELMYAVEKVKMKDLDFSIKNVENNEIGDLASAFEGMREELKDSLIREWQLEQDRRDMVSAITHDIKTPLAIIQGHIEGLQDGLKNDTEKLDSYLDTIGKNVFRAKKLVDEMNELVEVDSIDFSLDRRETDLPGLITEKTTELKLLAEKRGIKIETELADARQDNRPVYIDGGRLEQVIDNLLGNSIRFTPEGGTVRLSVYIEDNNALFIVRDTGPGFAEKDLNNLFRKFYKGDTSRSAGKGHCGLGLYITKTLVEKSGGKIKASNNKEGGACVEFGIPF
ncbi:MAG: HAMP domain-containing sensor histidine kinase [Bacillota bacterium]|nr:HAMP domain-containing sensor histidine kinase [Bacillota bacterium]